MERDRRSRSSSSHQEQQRRPARERRRGRRGGCRPGAPSGRSAAVRTARERAVNVALERGLDLGAVRAPRAGSTRTSVDASHLARRPVDGPEDIISGFENAVAVYSVAGRQLPAAPPRRRPPRGAAPRRRRGAARQPQPRSDAGEDERRDSGRIAETRRSPASRPASASAAADPGSDAARRAGRGARRPGRDPARRTAPPETPAGRASSAATRAPAAAARAPGQREERDAERLHETGGRQRGRQRQQRPAERKNQTSGAAPGKAEQERLKRQPLARKAIERAAGPKSPSADEKEGRGPRHPLPSPPNCSICACRSHHDAARAEEQQPLEDRVVQHVVEARRDAERRELAAPRASADHPGPRPSRMIPMFSMVRYASSRLRSCCVSAYRTPSTAESAPDTTNGHAPGQRRDTQAEGADPEQAVDARLDHARPTSGRRRCSAPPGAPPAATRGAG